MKKIYLSGFITFIVCISGLKSNATTLLINVEDFQFNPSNVTITLGDTIKWLWDNSAGAHTTTSTTIPGGAVAWDKQINSNTPVFIYVPTVTGIYNYQCTYHVGSGMTGHFIVQSASGISDIPAVTSMFLIGSNIVTNELNLTYSIPKASALTIKMFNISGKAEFTIVSSNQNAGIYTQTFPIPPGLVKGIHLITIETQDAILSKKIFIQ